MKAFIGSGLLTLAWSALWLPAQLVYAQNSGVDQAREFVGRINDAILFPLISLLLGIAMIVFLYGAFEYVANADNDSARETGRQHMLWGVVGFLVMVSAMAILEIAASTFGLSGQLQEVRP